MYLVNFLARGMLSKNWHFLNPSVRMNWWIFLSIAFNFACSWGLRPTNLLASFREGILFADEKGEIWLTFWANDRKTGQQDAKSTNRRDERGKAGISGNRTTWQWRKIFDRRQLLYLLISLLNVIGFFGDNLLLLDEMNWPLLTAAKCFLWAKDINGWLLCHGFPSISEHTPWNMPWKQAIPQEPLCTHPLIAAVGCPLLQLLGAIVRHSESLRGCCLILCPRRAQQTWLSGSHEWFSYCKWRGKIQITQDWIGWRVIAKNVETSLPGVEACMHKILIVKAKLQAMMLWFDANGHSVKSHGQSQDGTQSITRHKIAQNERPGFSNSQARKMWHSIWWKFECNAWQLHAWQTVPRHHPLFGSEFCWQLGKIPVQQRLMIGKFSGNWDDTPKCVS